MYTKTKDISKVTSGDDLEVLDTFENAFSIVCLNLPIDVLGLQLNRTIDHDAGSHGIPGIFFVYDIFPLVVKITYDRELLGTFFTRLAALAGGIFATVAYLREILSNLPDILLRTRLGRQWNNNWIRRKRSICTKLSEHLPNGLDKTVFLTAPSENVLNPDSDT